VVLLPMVLLPPKLLLLPALVRRGSMGAPGGGGAGDDAMVTAWFVPRDVSVPIKTSGLADSWGSGRCVIGRGTLEEVACEGCRAKAVEVEGGRDKLTPGPIVTLVRVPAFITSGWGSSIGFGWLTTRCSVSAAAIIARTLCSGVICSRGIGSGSGSATAATTMPCSPTGTIGKAEGS
jgi:hypothetical protein